MSLESITDKPRLTYHSELPKVDLVSEVQFERLRAVGILLTQEEAIVAQVITIALVLDYVEVRVAVGERDSQQCAEGGRGGRERGREEGREEGVSEGGRREEGVSEGGRKE